MAKIAIDLERALAHRHEHGMAGGTSARVIAQADGWSVADIVCTSGPRDRVFEEQHKSHAIALVVAGSFQYQSPLGHALLTPGAVMLGHPGLRYECGHEHGEGDRCVCFFYQPEYFERLAADAGVKADAFERPTVPPVRQLAPLVALASAGVVDPHDVPWEEVAVTVATHTLVVSSGLSAGPIALPPNALARVTAIVRSIERHPDGEFTLGRLARLARLSPYHFLRTFEQITGVTPHQFLLRTRLREAAIRLAGEPGRILDIALDCGFGDISNFNKAFRAEFGVNPRAWRQSPR